MFSLVLGVGVVATTATISAVSLFAIEHAWLIQIKILPLLSIGALSLSALFLRSVLQHQEKVDTSEERLRLALEASSGGVWDWNLKTDEVIFDRKWSSMLGYETKEIPRHFDSFRKLCHPEDLAKTLERMMASIEGPIPTYKAEFRMQSKDGSYRWIASEGIVKRSSDGKAQRMIGWHRDITEEKMSEILIERQRLQLINTAKMSALGEMSGGIAHEINNPLAIIHGCATQIQIYAKKEEIDRAKIEKSVGTVMRTVDRISKILKSMKAFARDETLDPQEDISVSRIVQETLELCQTRFYHHGILLGIPKDIPDVQISCRLSEVMQVLLNLLNNSADAIEHLDDKWVKIEIHEPNSTMVQFWIEDAGSPIPHDVVDRLFQPFFTTKEVGKGTGLGLSISKRLIESNGGRIFYDRKATRARFVVEMPKAFPTKEMQKRVTS